MMQRCYIYQKVDDIPIYFFMKIIFFNTLFLKSINTLNTVTILIHIYFMLW